MGMTHTPPETGGEVRVNILGKFLPSREKGLKILRAHARIFGRIDSPPALAHNLIKFVKQLQRLLTAIGKIEREGYARSRERKHAGGLDSAKCLEDSQKGPFARAPDAID